MSIGQTLRDARQRQGFSLKDLEATTKIRTHYLNALEEENFAELPGHTYVIGFLRTYARALGLDSQGLVDEYKAKQQEPVVVIKSLDPVAPPIRQRPYSLRRIAIIAGLCILALFTVYGMNEVWSGAKTPAPAAQPADKPANVPAANRQAQPQTPPQPVNQQPAPIPATNNSATQDNTGLSLEMTFTDRCWLIIKVDGQQVFADTVPAGQTKNITAKEKIEFPSIGSAGAVKLVLNGKPLPSLGEVGAVIHNKSLTKNDIPQ